MKPDAASLKHLIRRCFADVKEHLEKTNEFVQKMLTQTPEEPQEERSMFGKMKDLGMKALNTARKAFMSDGDRDELQKLVGGFNQLQQRATTRILVSCSSTDPALPNLAI